MQLSPAMLFRGIGWIAGLFILSAIIRFGSNISLTRLLTPEILGAVLVILTVRNAVELMSDVGIGQNIVASRNGDDPVFRSTAWLMQCLRGTVLGFFMYIASSYIADVYAVPVSAIELAALTLVLAGFSSVSIYVMQRKLQVARISLFDFSQELVAVALAILAASISPTVWALVVANLVATIIRTTATYFLPAERTKFEVKIDYAKEIFHFGKWIFLMSALMLLCTTFDKLYLGQAIPLAVVGIYGVAKAISDIPWMLAARICHTLIFPAIASAASKPREALRADVGPTRFKVLLFGGVMMGFGITVSDIAVEFVYDSRYHDAGAMLSILLFAVWFAIISNINEYTLLGLAKPKYAVAGNILKAITLVVGMPFALVHGGVLAAISVLAIAEMPRMGPIAFGLLRENVHFFRQDILATVCLVASLLVFTGLRAALGFGYGFLGLLF